MVDVCIILLQSLSYRRFDNPATLFHNNPMPLISSARAAERAGVSRSTICRWVALGVLPAKIVAGRPIIDSDRLAKMRRPKLGRKKDGIMKKGA